MVEKEKRVLLVGTSFERDFFLNHIMQELEGKFWVILEGLNINYTISNNSITFKKNNMSAILDEEGPKEEKFKEFWECDDCTSEFPIDMFPDKNHFLCDQCSSNRGHKSTRVTNPGRVFLEGDKKLVEILYKVFEEH